MKFISFLLILSIILCYTGLGMGVSHSSTHTNITNCHKNQHDEISGAELIANSYENDATHHKMFKCCYEALTNAPLSHDFDLRRIILCQVAVNMPTLEINDVPGFPFSLEIKEHHPPELFLSNSSFLL